MFKYIKNKFDSFMRKVRSTGSLPKIQQNKDTPIQKDKYQFINKIYSKHLNCTNCSDLMNAPQRLHPCGHTFCYSCAPLKGKCPTCSTKIQATQKDLIGEGLINEMTVRCLNSGCPFKGKFDDYKKFHQKQCKLNNGLDQWIKSMQGTLDQHVFNHKNDESQKQEAQKEQKDQKEEIKNKPSSQLKRPKSPQKVYEFEQQLLKKSFKAQL